MSAGRRSGRTLLVVLTLLCLAGCTVKESMTRPTAARADAVLEKGDDAVVELKDGRRFKVFVVRITDEELITREHRFKWGDIRRVQYREVSFWKSLAAAGVTAYIAAAIGLALLLDGLNDADWDICP